MDYIDYGIYEPVIVVPVTLSCHGVDFMVIHGRSYSEELRDGRFKENFYFDKVIMPDYDEVNDYSEQYEAIMKEIEAENRNWLSRGDSSEIKRLVHRKDKIIAKMVAPINFAICCMIGSNQPIKISAGEYVRKCRMVNTPERVYSRCDYSWSNVAHGMISLRFVK